MQLFKQIEQRSRVTLTIHFWISSRHLVQSGATLNRTFLKVELNIQEQTNIVHIFA